MYDKTPYIQKKTWFNCQVFSCFWFNKDSFAKHDSVQTKFAARKAVIALKKKSYFRTHPKPVFLLFWKQFSLTLMNNRFTFVHKVENYVALHYSNSLQAKSRKLKWHKINMKFQSWMFFQVTGLWATSSVVWRYLLLYR